MFLISADVAGYGMDADVVGCFDPTVVVVRLKETFPDVEVIPEDFAWRVPGVVAGDEPARVATS